MKYYFAKEFGTNYRMRGYFGRWIKTEYKQLLK